MLSFGSKDISLVTSLKSPHFHKQYFCRYKYILSCFTSLKIISFSCQRIKENLKGCLKISARKDSVIEMYIADKCVIACVA